MYSIINLEYKIIVMVLILLHIDGLPFPYEQPYYGNGFGYGPGYGYGESKFYYL